MSCCPSNGSNQAEKLFIINNHASGHQKRENINKKKISKGVWKTKRIFGCYEKINKTVHNHNNNKWNVTYTSCCWEGLTRTKVLILILSMRDGTALQPRMWECSWENVPLCTLFHRRLIQICFCSMWIWSETLLLCLFLLLFINIHAAMNVALATSDAFCPQIHTHTHRGRVIRSPAKI